MSAPAETLFHDGNRHLAAGDLATAERCFREALAINPEFAEVLTNLGLIREQAGAITEAEACHREALRLRPDFVRAYLNLGVLLMNQKRLTEAETVYHAALQLAPDSPAAWSNLGVLLTCMQREDEAEACCREALRLDGGYAKAAFNLGYLLLRQGRYAEGWERFEARDWYAVLERHFACPRWRGEEVAGRSIIIGFEAGHGDMIQFGRYAALLKRRGAGWVALVCHPGLKSLFRSLPGVDELFAFNEDVPATGWDFWTPPLSLPYYFQTRLDSIPAEIPYLAPDADKQAEWLRRLPTHGRRVGLVWKGNPRFENDGERSLPSLALLAELGTVPGIAFVSLQKGAGEAEALQPPLGLELCALGGDLTDFADTAAVVAGLELVISVDTAVAHLAGALGVPCWVLLPDYLTDWRWLTERRDSPWYPGRMRLFRQAHGGGWPPVIAEVVAALREWVTTPGA